MSHIAGTILFLSLVLAIAAPLAVSRKAANAATPQTPSGVPRSQRITVIGHRGNSSHAPENTLSSFRGAIEAKADYAELDAYPSADGTLWVLHDATLDRTTDVRKHLPGEKIKIAKVHDEVLKKLDAGVWYDKSFKGEKLPTLAEALDTIQRGAKTLLERKEGDAKAYADLLKSKKLVDKLVVQAFDWDFLAKLHTILPKQTLAALGDKQLDEARLAKLPSTGVKIVAWNFKDLSNDNIKDLQRRGYLVWSWTVDEPGDWQRLIADGINGIITNRPGELRAWLAASESADSQPAASSH